MVALSQAGCVLALVLGVAYLSVPRRIHEFGFEFLRRSSPERSGASTPPALVYRGLGVLFVAIGLAGLL